MAAVAIVGCAGGQPELAPEDSATAGDDGATMEARAEGETGPDDTVADIEVPEDTVADIAAEAGNIDADDGLETLGPEAGTPAQDGNGAGQGQPGDVEGARAAAQQASAEQTAERQLTTQELRNRVREFADQYRSELATVCDQIKRNNADDTVKQLKAQKFKIDGSTAMYDIAVDPDPRRALLNMLVLVTLQSYAANTHAEKDFPEDHQKVRMATERLMRDGWQLSTRVLDERLRAELLAIIDRWWDDNTEEQEIWYVRLSELADYSEGTSFAGAVGKGIGGAFRKVTGLIPLAGTGQEVAQTASEAQETAEKFAWLAPRLLILAQWRGEALILETLVTSEINSTITAVEKAAETAANLPQEIDRQREALISDLAENEEELGGIMSEARLTVESADELTGSATELVRATDSLAASIDTLLASVRELQGEPKEGDAEQQGEPFDIKEYTEAINAANRAIEQTTELVSELEEVTEPGDLESRISSLMRPTEELVGRVSSEVQRIVLIAAGSVAAAGILIVLVAKRVPGRR